MYSPCTGVHMMVGRVRSKYARTVNGAKNDEHVLPILSGSMAVAG